MTIIFDAIDRAHYLAHVRSDRLAMERVEIIANRLQADAATLWSHDLGPVPTGYFEQDGALYLSGECFEDRL